MLTQIKLARYLPQKQWENPAKDEYGFSHFKKKIQAFFLPHYKVTEEQWIIKKIGQLLNKLCSYLL